MGTVVRDDCEAFVRRVLLVALVVLLCAAMHHAQRERAEDCKSFGGHAVETGPFSWECRHEPAARARASQEGAP